ncbi:peptidoglycan-binding domain-containing protein [Streptomyces acidiscabies]|uniref:Peptidoglycan-binding protein n=1 Tax=Streptomyces acidiscabies TaxID=42234 RepID=A0AAP6B6W7_9ACTN|nr:peptidoglycan-binding domain-containing protein [Streptomyces acidiscabies]MBP5939893.1 peptidoglycan-binding protein [Streptomyces sp. LBUM 1476]MBZ3911078.1 peptidoglycan-binding protein [Streptomyces acidiscabies]MDX2959140.1 peptidoglycan-binding protein [Streptomyces acidiscabies]MDX3025736.1 peptidoglycan-binding protein [Streptomyces acidiscabies]MDX3788191.1 peptidoglycan-binding protein [Streptomyces acidiscabies]
MNEPTGREGPAGPQGPYGHPCPECGALRAADSTPSCDCARRAAETLKEARLAEAAAAEDFDPLRIRPYVELAGTAGAPVAGGRPPGPPADATMPLRAVPASAESFPDAMATAPLPRVPGGGTGARRGSGEVGVSGYDGVARGAGAGGVGPLDGVIPAGDAGSLGDVGSLGGVDPDGVPEPGSRRRRTVLLTTSGAVVAILAAAGFASGLFAYDAPVRDGSPPEDIRAAVPVPSRTVAASVEAPAERSAVPAPVSEAATPSESAAPSPSPTPSRSSSPSPSASGSPSAEASPSGGAADDQRQVPSLTVAVLRRGDTGTEVRELQLRLKELSLYGEDADGVFDEPVENALKNYQWSRNITGDELGVYGAATRERLEKETKEP